MKKLGTLSFALLVSSGLSAAFFGAGGVPVGVNSGCLTVEQEKTLQREARAQERARLAAVMFAPVQQPVAQKNSTSTNWGQGSRARSGANYRASHNGSDGKSKSAPRRTGKAAQRKMKKAFAAAAKKNG